MRNYLLILVMLASARDTASGASCIPGFDFAIFAKDSLDFQGNATTDSWDSSQGTYAATSACADGSVGIDGTGPGALHVMSGAAKVCGNAQIGAGGNVASVITGNGSITGTRSAQSTNLALPNVTVPAEPNAAPLDVSYTNTAATLAPGKTYGNVSCKNGSLTLGPGTYVVSTLTLTANCALTVTSGPVAVYFTSSMDLHAGAIANHTGVPANLMFYGGPAATSVQFQGGAGAYAAIYAPTAACTLQGNADDYGAMVCASAHVQGNAHIHFDKALRNFAGAGFACALVEISRANPIVATVSNQTAIVQGTYELPSGTPRQINAVSDVAAYQFPYEKGHLRARTASSVTSSASSFSSGTVLFDAATVGLIPAARRVFTSTAAAFHPAIVPFDDADASTIGAQIAPASVVPGIGAAQWKTIVHDVLAGALGGVDRSTAAVIGPSDYAGVATRPQMIYFGAADGMLHAVCGQVSTECPSLGTELWAFVPREELPLMRTNTQRIDGSPHALDVFGDFASPPTGVRSWHTLLLFQTGYRGTSTAATYALDVTDPANPSIVWAYATAGTGLTIASGQVTILGAPTTLAFVETNTGGAGVALTAIDVVTGQARWTFTYAYPSPPRGVAADLPLPASGIPGGAAAVDLVGSGFVTDVVFGDLYGDLWRLDATTGASRNGPSTPLFRFTTNKHPIGVVPTIYSNGGQELAFFASGGYADPNSASWSASTQYAIAVRLAASSAPVTEASTACASCDLAIASTLAAGDKGFAQAVVIGTQLFVTSDSTDVNATTFGTGGNTGHMTAIDLGSGTVGATIAIVAGASSLAHSGTTLYASSAQAQEEITTSAATTVGTATEITAAQSFRQMLWLGD